MCGDTVEIQVKLDDGVIADFAFQGDGCAISQAAASMLSEKLHGMSIDAVEELDRDDMVEMLNIDISPMRIKCAVLCQKAVQDGAKSHRDNTEIKKTTTTPES